MLNADNNFIYTRINNRKIQRIQSSRFWPSPGWVVAESWLMWETTGRISLPVDPYLGVFIGMTATHTHCHTFQLSKSEKGTERKGRKPNMQHSSAPHRSFQTASFFVITSSSLSWIKRGAGKSHCSDSINSHWHRVFFNRQSPTRTAMIKKGWTRSRLTADSRDILEVGRETSKDSFHEFKGFRWVLIASKELIDYLHWENKRRKNEDTFCALQDNSGNMIMTITAKCGHMSFIKVDHYD